MSRDEALACVLAELTRAEQKYPAFGCPHEVHGVIQKQINDFARQIVRGHDADLLHDLPQIAAAALRGLIDCCEAPVAPKAGSPV